MCGSRLLSVVLPWLHQVTGICLWVTLAKSCGTAKKGLSDGWWSIWIIKVFNQLITYQGVQEGRVVLQHNIERSGDDNTQHLDWWEHVGKCVKLHLNSLQSYSRERRVWISITVLVIIGTYQLCRLPWCCYRYPTTLWPGIKQTNKPLLFRKRRNEMHTACLQILACMNISVEYNRMK